MLPSPGGVAPPGHSSTRAFREPRDNTEGELNKSSPGVSYQAQCISVKSLHWVSSSVIPLAPSLRPESAKSNELVRQLILVASIRRGLTSSLPSHRVGRKHMKEHHAAPATFSPQGTGGVYQVPLTHLNARLSMEMPMVGPRELACPLAAAGPLRCCCRGVAAATSGRARLTFPLDAPASPGFHNLTLYSLALRIGEPLTGACPGRCYSGAASHLYRELFEKKKYKKYKKKVYYGLRLCSCPA